MHQNGVSTQNIVAKEIAPKRTVYRLIKTYKETGSLKVKKAPGRKKSTSDHDDRALVQSCLLNRSASSQQLVKEWKKGGVSTSTRTINEQFRQDTCIFQHNGTPCYNAKRIK